MTTSGRNRRITSTTRRTFSVLQNTCTSSRPAHAYSPPSIAAAARASAARMAAISPRVCVAEPQSPDVIVAIPTCQPRRRSSSSVPPTRISASSGCAMKARSVGISVLSQLPHLVLEPEVLPALQRDRDVALAPQAVVELAQLECVPLDAARVGQELEDLVLADLVRDRLTRRGGEEARL